MQCILSLKRVQKSTYEKSGNICGGVNGQRDSYPNYEPLLKK